MFNILWFFCRIAVVAVVTVLSAWGQTSKPWEHPVRFDSTTTGATWAIRANVVGQVNSDGKTVDISIEHCDLYRPGTFETPQEVTKITASIVRQGANRESRQVIFGDSHIVNQTLRPDQTIRIEPFQLRIPLGTYPLAKGDTLAISIILTKGLVPISVKEPLPVTQVPAYCADTMQESGLPDRRYIEAYRVCQDSAGRKRRERWAFPAADAPRSAGKLISIELLDPVANLIVNLDPRTKKGSRRMGFTSMAGFGVPIGGLMLGNFGGPPALNPIEPIKPLGTRQINGVDADGKLLTTVYPTGYQGRQEEVMTSEETWYCFRIQASVRRVRTDPRNGNLEYQMKNIELGEPDAGLFKVPDDYEITDVK
jgi:hypothetical protein